MPEYTVEVEIVRHVGIRVEAESPTRAFNKVAKDTAGWRYEDWENVMDGIYGRMRVSAGDEPVMHWQTLDISQDTMLEPKEMTHEQQV